MIGRVFKLPVVLLVVVGVYSQTVGGQECLCPTRNRNRLSVCEQSRNRGKRAVEVVWTARSGCCSGEILKGLALGCAFSGELCKCPTPYRQYLAECEATSQLDRYVAKQDCCNGRISLGRTLGCAFNGPKTPNCAEDGNSRCQHTCRDTSKGYQCSCRPGYTLSTADPTKCEKQECLCPRENRARLSACEVQVPRRGKRAEAIWTANDPCCNGGNLKGLVYGCAFINNVCKCPASARSSLPECEATPVSTTYLAREECCSGSIAQGRTYGCSYSDARDRFLLG